MAGQLPSLTADELDLFRDRMAAAGQWGVVNEMNTNKFREEFRLQPFLPPAIKAAIQMLKDKKYCDFYVLVAEMCQANGLHIPHEQLLFTAMALDNLSKFGKLVTLDHGGMLAIMASVMELQSRKDSPAYDEWHASLAALLHNFVLNELVPVRKYDVEGSYGYFFRVGGIWSAREGAEVVRGTVQRESAGML